jgi:8-oxo-dGTP pyrophosphatase MutT (NUDIX family)
MAEAPGGHDGVPVRDAATVILVREGTQGREVLMGARGARAAFMPAKVVFPGGAVDPGDAAARLAAPVRPDTAALLAERAAPGLGPALAAAALRELSEETGLCLGRAGAWPGVAPGDWAAFARRGLLPDPSALRFVFRAITPKGSPRRFDARFFLADAAAVAGDPEDFSEAADELSGLRWVTIPKARRLDLPFITEIVLAEVEAADLSAPQPARVPFFDNSGEAPLFRWLGQGRAA